MRLLAAACAFALLAACSGTDEPSTEPAAAASSDASGSGGANGTGGQSADTGTDVVVRPDGSLGGGGAAGTGGAVGTGGAGTGGAVGTGGTSACPAPPTGVSTDAANAYALENDTRAAMGIPCAAMVTLLNTSASSHCDYYTQNLSSGATFGGTACATKATAHNEVQGCDLFTGATPGAREKAAGYTSSSWSEDMAFSANGAQAVQAWIDSVWHRTPILSPWTRDFGYGAAKSGSVLCDTMDFGPGTSTASTVVATYPYSGQTGAPTSFDGSHEGPAPPAPPSGWPSGYPIHVYAQKATVTTHEIRSGGCTGTALAHQWITPGGPGDPGLLRNEQILYADAPLQAKTSYCVIVQGTQATTPAQPLDLSWTFTTR
jgi:hypothetical protein